MHHEQCRLTDLRLRRLQREATQFARRLNRPLPRRCPQCHARDHIPGLPCLSCGHIHPEPICIVYSTEWGYAVRAVAPGRPLVAAFELPRPEKHS